MSNSDKNSDLKKYLDIYLANLNKFPENLSPEFEIKFGTKKIKNISRIDFYNVIKILLNYGFKLNTDSYLLRIQNDDKKNNIRTQIFGLPNIQQYCKFNNLVSLLDEKYLTFEEKNYFKQGDKTLYPIDKDDYNFRISFMTEKLFNKSNEKVQELIDKWSSLKKTFRYIKRYEYTHPDAPVKIHMSIVKNSKTQNSKMIGEFNISESNVFNSYENYEIEIELDNQNILSNKKFETSEYLHSMLKRVIKYILIGLQETNFPISINEIDEQIQEYLILTKDKQYEMDMKYSTRDFIGPSSITLQMINLLGDSDIDDTNKTIPNIRNNYTVTDKADGMRKLLFINSKGIIYFITTNVNVQFSGCFTENKDLFNSIIDGEHILHNKKGEYINHFGCFDIYYLNKKNITGLPFIDVTESKDDSVNKKEEKLQRLIILSSLVNKINMKSIVKDGNTLKLFTKKFYTSSEKNTIFECCKKILTYEKEGLFEYNTDGLIFTPANTGVSSKQTGVVAPNHKVTWRESFKWKPSEFNTIDFLVRFKKNELGGYYIGNLNNDGVNMSKSSQISNYYTLILHIGFDEKKHGYINPYNDLINGYVKKNSYDKNNYKPARFYPTNPSDENAGLCNIIGRMDESNNLKIYTEEGEEIEDNTIVEFKYDSTRENFWKWIPIRVRSDKTSELRNGGKNFGNSYEVANENWKSIHNPITNEIITTGANVSINLNDDDIYYNKVTNKTETRSLRDFHNLFVKSQLIQKISKQNESLIDYAVGKGGDLPKWIHSKLGFVLGIDLSKDNIENRLDGACARYLNYLQSHSVIPKALFLNGNSQKNIKSGAAFKDDKSKQILKAVFGEGQKNEIVLGRGVYNNYGIVKDGFNISSIQFAIHYMFEDNNSLQNFLRNVSECTKIDGYFIGTCYDGNKIFNLLRDKEYGDSISIMKNDKKIWQICKKYSNKNFESDETCLGYQIDIYQETINQYIKEYLVNFEYLTRIMENYGFVKLSEDELKTIGLTQSIGNFELLFNIMKTEVEKNKFLKNRLGSAINMTDEEKKISFLNNYFIFKKVRNSDFDAEQGLSVKDKDEEIKQQRKDMEIMDQEVEKIEKEDLTSKSKKLAEKFLKESEESHDNKDKSKIDKTKKESITEDEKIKMKKSIEEKLKALKEKKSKKESKTKK